MNYQGPKRPEEEERSYYAQPFLPQQPPQEGPPQMTQPSQPYYNAPPPQYAPPQGAYQPQFGYGLSPSPYALGPYMPPPPRYPALPRLSKVLTGIGIAVMCFAVLNFVCSFAAVLLTNLVVGLIGVEGQLVWVVEAIRQLMFIIAAIATLILPFGCYAKFVKMPAHLIFPHRRFGFGLFMVALCITLGVAFVGNYASGVLGTMLQEFGLFTSPPIPLFGTETFPNVLIFLSATVVPALFEEFAFRGVLLSSLRRYGNGFAIIATATLFALCHPSVLQVIPTFLIGLVLGYFVVLSGSVWVGVLIHFLYNSLAVGMNQLSVILPENAQIAVSLFLFVGMIALGILGVIVYVFVYAKPLKIGMKNKLPPHIMRYEISHSVGLWCALVLLFAILISMMFVL